MGKSLFGFQLLGIPSAVSAKVGEPAGGISDCPLKAPKGAGATPTEGRDVLSAQVEAIGRGAFPASPKVISSF